MKITNIIIAISVLVGSDIAVGPQANASAWLVKPKIGAGVSSWNNTLVGRVEAGLGVLQIDDYSMQDYRLLGTIDNMGIAGFSLYWASEGFTETKYKRIYIPPTYYRLAGYRDSSLSIGAGLKLGTMDMGVGYRANKYKDGIYFELSGGI